MAIAFGRKAPVAIELCLIAPKAAVWQLSHPFGIHRFDKARLDGLRCRKVFLEHGKQIIITGRNVRRNYTKGTRI